MFRNGCLAVMVCMVCGVNAFAQGTYVSASLFGDISRSTHTEFPGVDEAGSGEAIGFALRAGTPLGAIWGVELEFARPGEIEGDSQSRALPVSQTTISYSFVDGVPSPIRPIVPPFFYDVQTRQRNSTLSAALWAHQQLTSRVAMVYLGGVAFSRTEFEYEVTYSPFVEVTPVRFDPSVIPISFPGTSTSLILPPVESRTVTYGVRPMVGIESRIAMTEHLHLVPGMRLHGAAGGWLIRPAVGLAWTF